MHYHEYGKVKGEISGIPPIFILYTLYSRQEYWNGLPFPSPRDLPNPGIKPGSPALLADSLPTELQGMPIFILYQWVTGEGNGTPLQYSCLENPMDGGAWWAAVHGVAESEMTERLYTFMHWRRKWQPTPVFLPGESQGRWSLVGWRLCDRTE